MADQRIQYTEKVVGYGHPTLPDTLNRALMVEHNPDGTHDRSLLNLEIISDSSPSPTYSYQRWINTSTVPAIEYIRNRENSAWIKVGTIDPSLYTTPKSTDADHATLADDSTKVGGYAPSWYVPAGAIMPFGMSTAPTGWLACDGSDKKRTDYPNLFAAIGTTFGDAGGDSAQFTLPLIHDFIRGANPGVRNVGTLQEDALQNVTGQFGVDHLQAGATFNGPFYKGSGNGNGSEASGGPGLNVHFDMSLAARTDTETRPRNIALLYCIKY